METTLLIKTKKTLKHDAQQVAQELGIPLGTAINAFLKQFVREQELTLSLHAEKPSPYLIDIIQTAQKDIKKKTNISPLFTDEKKALLWLKKRK